MASFTLFAQDFYIVDSNSKLNVRAHSSSNSNVITQLKPGTKIPVYGFDGKWAQTKINGAIGYVHSDYLKFSHHASNESQKETAPKGETKLFPWTQKYKNNDISNFCFWLSIISILLGAICIIYLYPQKSNFNTLYLGILALSIGSIGEIIYFISSPEFLWFCYPSRVGILMMIIDFILFGIFVLLQGSAFFKALKILEHKGGMKCRFKLSFVGIPIILILFIIAIKLSPPLVTDLIWATAILLLLQFVFILFSSIKQKEFLLGGIISLFFLIGLVGTAIVFTSFACLILILALIILGAYVVLSILSATPNRSTTTKLIEKESGKEIEVDEFGYGNDGHKYGQDTVGKWERKY